MGFKRTIFLFLFIFIVMIGISCERAVESPTNQVLSTSTSSSASSGSITPSISPSATNIYPYLGYDPNAPQGKELIKDNAIKADLIILAKVTELKCEIVTSNQSGVIGRRVFSIFTLTIEKTIRGDISIKEVYIRLPGGTVTGENGISEMPTMGYFTLNEELLACLKKEANGYYVGSGPICIPWSKDADGKEFIITIADTGERMTLSKLMGLIIVALQDNHIPVALPQNQWPPLPAPPTIAPVKSTGTTK